MNQRLTTRDSPMKNSITSRGSLNEPRFQMEPLKMEKAIRIAGHERVGGVEHLQAKLELRSFGDLEVLHYSRVQLPELWPAQPVVIKGVGVNGCERPLEQRRTSGGKELRPVAAFGFWGPSFLPSTPPFPPLVLRCSSGRTAGGSTSERNCIRTSSWLSN